MRMPRIAPPLPQFRTKAMLPLQPTRASKLCWAASAREFMLRCPKLPRRRLHP